MKIVIAMIAGFFLTAGVNATPAADGEQAQLLSSPGPGGSWGCGSRCRGGGGPHGPRWPHGPHATEQGIASLS